MKNNPVFESRLHIFLIELTLSSNSGACEIFRSPRSMAAKRVLKPERVRAVLTALMSTFSCSSAAGASEAEMLKNDRKRAGTLCWCFVSHNGVKTRSGKMGEPGDKGDKGE